jgi:hypothetical protein
MNQYNTCLCLQDGELIVLACRVVVRRTSVLACSRSHRVHGFLFILDSSFRFDYNLYIREITLVKGNITVHFILQQILCVVY